MCDFLLVFTLIQCYFGLSYQGNGPKLKPFAFDRNLISGQRAQVFCQLLSGMSPLSFQWSKDGHHLQSDSSPAVGVVIEDHEDYSSLTIDRISGKSSGNYSCLVSNSYGSDTFSSVLIVQDVIWLENLVSSVIIPTSVAIVIIVMACSAAYVYIKFEERNAQIIKAGMLSVSPSKNFQYINTASTPQTSGRQSVVSEEGALSFRYSDSSDRTRPLLARPPVPTVLWAQHQEPILEESDDYPSPYATLPFQKLTSFKSPPTAQPPPPPLPPENRRYIQDEKGLLYETSPQTSSANIFCKVDVHNQDNSDSYDEFFRPHHV